MKKLEYGIFSGRLKQFSAAKGNPHSALFELTYRCNFRCRHCYVCKDGKKKELDTEGVFFILDTLADAGVFTLGFTGGEPFVRKDIVAILRYARQKGFNIIILTNGSLITPSFARELGRLSMNKVDVSFHSTDREIFDWVVQVRGAQKRVLRGIELLRDNKVNVFFKTTAMNFNKFDVQNIRLLAEKRFRASFRWSAQVNRDWRRKKNTERFRLSPRDAALLSRAMEQKGGRPEKTDECSLATRPSAGGRAQPFICGAGVSEVVIDPYGNMRACIDIPFPKFDLTKGDFSQGWSKITEFVRNVSASRDFACRRCPLAAFCTWCPAIAWQEHRDFVSCSRFCRENAREKQDKN